MRQVLEKAEIPEPECEAFFAAASRFLGRPEVVGVDVGSKVTEGKTIRSELCVRIYVREKVPMSLLLPRETIPDKILDVPTDVVVKHWRPHRRKDGDFNPAARQPQSVVRPGLSVGVRGGGSGTLGLLGSSLDDPSKPLWLVSDHVLNPGTSSSDGVLLQPGPSDAHPDGAKVIGRAEGRHQAMGLAVAAVEPGGQIAPELFGTRARVISGFASPVRGQTLMKYGRSTGVTRGIVDGIGTFVGGPPLGFVLLPPPDITYPEISEAGDSGAIWFNPETSEAVGMQNWGEPDGLFDEEWALASTLAAPFLEDLRFGLASEEG